MQPEPNSEIEDAVFFGPFKLSAARRLLERYDRPVAIGARALDILIVLVQRAGKTVSQQELLDAVWPNLFVAESALRVHINKLRQVLGEAPGGAAYVQNVAGRGYCFVEPVKRSSQARSWQIVELRWAPQRNVPAAPLRMIGRDEILSEIASRVLAHRFVTMIGPGGVGKTTVCVAVCHAVAEAFDGKVIFVDLGAISDPQLVLTTIRSALRLPSNIDSLPGLIGALKGHRLLMVLDCCEHVADEAARIAEGIFQNTPGCHLLLTSREPLHCDGEQVFSIPPLPFPPATESLNAEDALEYPAIKLFVDSVNARDHGFQLQNADAPIAASICRRVDGIALALELAAGRVSAFGLDEVHRQLEGRMKLVWQGRRTAPPRQQTLSATLDWSFRLLNEMERLLLCRLSIFVGTFTLEDANAVAASEHLTELQIAQHLGSLVNRCLIAVDHSGAQPNYRLLDMTREFARGKIETEREAIELARQHARYFLHILTDGTDARAGRLTMRQNIPPASRLGNVAAALDWCFSREDHDDTHLGQRLIAASGRFLLSQGLTFEFRKWAELALARLGPAQLGSRLELQLQILLASARTLAEHDIRSMIVDRAITLARDLGERRYYRTLLYERRYDQAFWGEPEVALQAAISSRAELSENDDPIELAIAEATIASISHTFGTDLKAHQHFRLAFRHLKDAGDRASDLIEENSFRRIRSTYANNLYTCGFVDQAAAIGQEFIDGFDTAKDFMAYREIMPRISFIFEWRQEWNKVAQIYNTLVKNSVGQPDDDMSYVHSIMRCKLLIQSGEIEESVTRLQEHHAEVPPLSPGRFILFVPLCEGLIGLGRSDEALPIITEALNYESKYSGSGFRSEYLLCRANILTAMQARDAAEIESVLRLSLEAASKQTSLSREIDAALALADLLHRQNRPSEGRAILKPVYDRFTEGFTTRVLARAKELLDDLDDQA